MPLFALVKKSTGVIQRFQSFDVAAPVLSSAKDLEWLPVEEKAVSFDAPSEAPISNEGKFVREIRAERPLSEKEVAARVAAKEK